MKLLRRYWLFLAIILIDLIIWLGNRELGTSISRFTIANFREMLFVIPPIFVLLGLMDVWVPREIMIKLMGPGSGLRGTALAIFLGAAAAGPLYGAFPIGVTMAKKGASLRNVFTFLGAWSTLKIPMFLFETAALGPLWSVTRWVVSVIGTIVIAGIIERALTAADRQQLLDNLAASGD
jgi:uncharacterized membrane protein YraQ (UPF0718 family)